MCHLASEKISANKINFITPELNCCNFLGLKGFNIWNEPDKEKYTRILAEADKVVYTSENYHAGCKHKRNRHMVDNSGVCICYLKKTSGGTAYTVDYAQNAGLEIINLAQTRR